MLLNLLSSRNSRCSKDDFSDILKRVKSFEKIKLDSESKEKSERMRIFESWQELTIGGGNKQEVELEELDNEQYKNLFYKTVESRLDETANILGINVDNALVERLDQAENDKEKSEAQKELIKSVVKQISSIPAGKWAFYPNEIERRRKINCSGSALLCGHILNKVGINTEYGYPAGHAINFVRLADGSLEYIDAHGNIIKDNIESEEEIIGGVKVRKINDKDIEYKLIPIFSQKDSIGTMLGNLESLKISAQKGDSEAKGIYENNRSLFDVTNYQILYESLYPEVGKLLKNREWMDEEKRVKDIHERWRRKAKNKKSR